MVGQFFGQFEVRSLRFFADLNDVRLPAPNPILSYGISGLSIVTRTTDCRDLPTLIHISFHDFVFLTSQV